MALSKEAREYFAKEGRKGGKATAKNRTADERRAAARKAIEARWAKQREELKALNRDAKALLDKATERAARWAKRKKEKAQQ